MTSFPNILAYCFIFSLFLSCKTNPTLSLNKIEEAQKNAQLANEGFARSLHFVEDWLNFVDPTSGLFPQNLGSGSDIWNGHNSAADNYPFMVLTALILDHDSLRHQMKLILEAERKLTARLGSLTDDYSFSKQGFNRTEIDTASIIFSSSEYIKDGLIPLTEYAGPTEWRDRMFEILDDLQRLTETNGLFPKHYFAKSKETEVYGELLQVLTRCYWMTQESKYLDWAIKIGDHYLIEDPNRLLQAEALRLRDHGCEIIGGLSELYATVHFVQPEKKKDYQPSLYALLDRVLATGRNADGMLYNEVNMSSGSVVNEGLVDNWGYIYNAYYTVYLVDGHDEYRQAVLQPFAHLSEKYHDYNWEDQSADGFADAIESGINLYNREQESLLMEWIDAEIQVLWSIQDQPRRKGTEKWANRGIIEGWHGDGNFARTTLMYCLQKTQDLRISPWRSDVLYGAVTSGDTLYVSIQASEAWSGKIIGSPSRQLEYMNMPLDYPRINQFPQWYAVDSEASYQIIDSNNSQTQTIKGQDFMEGVSLTLSAGERKSWAILKVEE